VQAIHLEPPQFACVVAADDLRGIGDGGDLPWPRLRGDLAHFRRLTTETRDGARQNAVIMGRVTWASIPERFRPLPGRINIIVSRAVTVNDGVVVAPGLNQALAAGCALGAESLFVVGGAQLYAAAILDARCRAIYYTRISGSYACDRFFPPFEAAFHRDLDEAGGDEGGAHFRFERWVR
jgi:dihydrofolate reductase